METKGLNSLELEFTSSLELSNGFLRTNPESSLAKALDLKAIDLIPETTSLGYKCWNDCYILLEEKPQDPD